MIKVYRGFLHQNKNNQRQVRIFCQKLYSLTRIPIAKAPTICATDVYGNNCFGKIFGGCMSFIEHTRTTRRQIQRYDRLKINIRYAKKHWTSAAIIPHIIGASNGEIWTSPKWFRFPYPLANLTSLNLLTRNTEKLERASLPETWINTIHSGLGHFKAENSVNCRKYIW